MPVTRDGILGAMSLEQIAGLAVALLVMAFGVVGTVVPGLPGSPVIVGVALVHRLVYGPAGASWWVLATIAALAAVAMALDWLATVYGAKKFGATWKGMAGAVVGAGAGLFFAPIGLVVGPFVGAMLLEAAGGRTWKESGRAGLGAVLGLLVGAVGKLACCTAMIGLFAFDVIRRSTGAP